MATFEDFQRLKVLIVEDQYEARMMIRNMLMEFGVNQIFEASDGKKGLQFTDTAFDLIDLIICDWNMPEMTGVELLRQLRSVGYDVPFLMVTGKADKAAVLEAKKSGVNGYICKPFSPVQLEAKLRILMQKSLVA
jgi:two-component system chemotaxis response regulator CheY